MKSLIIVAIIALFSINGLNAQKFCYVDTDYILNSMDEYKKAQDQVDKVSMDWQTELETKFAEIDKLYKAFQAESYLLPQDQKTKRENEIIQKEKEAKELQKKYFGPEGELFKKRQALVKPLQEKVYNAVKEYADENAYAIIFDKTSNANMLFASDKYDKSDDILKKLGYTPGKP